MVLHDGYKSSTGNRPNIEASLRPWSFDVAAAQRTSNQRQRLAVSESWQFCCRMLMLTVMVMMTSPVHGGNNRSASLAR